MIILIIFNSNLLLVPLIPCGKRWHDKPSSLMTLLHNSISNYQTSIYALLYPVWSHICVLPCTGCYPSPLPEASTPVKVSPYISTHARIFLKWNSRFSYITQASPPVMISPKCARGLKWCCISICCLRYFGFSLSWCKIIFSE